MTIKQRSPRNKSAEKLADEIAEKPYGKIIEPRNPPSKNQVRTSILIDAETHYALQDYSIENKRNGLEPKTITGIMRIAIDDYMKKYKVYIK